MRVQFYQHQENTMKTTCEELSKAEEKALLQQIIDSLPAGYLQTILLGVQPEIDWAISSDFGFINLSERFAELQEHREIIKTLKTTETELKESIRNLERKRDTLENGINELRSTIAMYSRI